MSWLIDSWLWSPDHTFRGMCYQEEDGGWVDWLTADSDHQLTLSEGCVIRRKMADELIDWQQTLITSSHFQRDVLSGGRWQMSWLIDSRLWSPDHTFRGMCYQEEDGRWVDWLIADSDHQITLCVIRRKMADELIDWQQTLITSSHFQRDVLSGGRWQMSWLIDSRLWSPAHTFRGMCYQEEDGRWVDWLTADSDHQITLSEGCVIRRKMADELIDWQQTLITRSHFQSDVLSGGRWQMSWLIDSRLWSPDHTFRVMCYQEEDGRWVDWLIADSDHQITLSGWCVIRRKMADELIDRQQTLITKSHSFLGQRLSNFVFLSPA